MATLNFFNRWNKVLLQITVEPLINYVFISITVRIPNQETPCTHEASDSEFN